MNTTKEGHQEEENNTDNNMENKEETLSMEENIVSENEATIAEDNHNHQSEAVAETATEPETISTHMTESEQDIVADKSDVELVHHDNHEEHPVIPNQEEIEAKFEELHDEDYSVLNKAELVKKLEEALSSDDFDAAKAKVKSIKNAYRVIEKDEYDTKKRLFLEAGGKKEEFAPVKDPSDEKFETLMLLFNHKREENRKQTENQLNDNLEQKKQVIEELKNLVLDEKNMSASIKKLHDLQNKWRSIGHVPQAFIEDTWRNYTYHINKFYDVLKINNELRDLDYKKNLELKTEICEKAEDLLLEPSIKKSFQQLRSFQEKWKTIGPVKREFQDIIWERFRSISDKIYERSKEYFKSLEEDEKKNLEVKLGLCEKAEAIADGNYSRVKEWQEGGDALEAIFDEWKKTGYAPKSHGDIVWKRFLDARNKFNVAREVYFKELKQTYNHNIKLKTDIINEAEALKDSTDWKATTDIYIRLRDQWKTIGHVPSKFSEKLWKRFNDACDVFFTNKKKHFAEREGKNEENLKLKEDLISRIEQYQLSKDNAENMNSLKEFQNEWMSIDFVPMKDKERINRAYRDAIDKKFEGMMGYSNQRTRDFNPSSNSGGARNYTGGRGDRSPSFRGNNDDRPEPRLSGAQERIRSIEKEVGVWENNIGFFGKSKNADKLKAEIQEKIDKAKAEIAELKKQIKQERVQAKEQTKEQPKE